MQLLHDGEMRLFVQIKNREWCTMIYKFKQMINYNWNAKCSVIMVSCRKWQFADVLDNRYWITGEWSCCIAMNTISIIYVEIDKTCRQMINCTLYVVFYTIIIVCEERKIYCLLKARSKDNSWKRCIEEVFTEMIL